MRAETLRLRLGTVTCDLSRAAFGALGGMTSDPAASMTATRLGGGPIAHQLLPQF